MRTVLVVLFATNVLLALVALLVLPPEIAIHFGRGGYPDGWASKPFGLGLPLVIQTLIFVALITGPSLLGGVPDRWISLPNKAYWLRPEHVEHARAALGRLLAEFGVAIFALLLLAAGLSLDANLSEPVRFREAWFLYALVAFGVYLLVWCVRLFRVFRVPAGEGG